MTTLALARARAQRGFVLAVAAWLIAGVAWAAPPTIETMAREAILVDADTGAVLLAKEPDRPMPPASMSKIMTIYMVFDQLKQKRLKLDDMLPVTENAWRAGGSASGGSTMFLKLNEPAKVEDLIQGVIVQSGNDASIVLAEGLGGSEAAFAEMMNKKAKELGLKNSSFANATGLPDPRQMMSSRDLATLANRTIKDFPEYYHYYGEKEFVHNNIKQGNRNPLLYKNIGADGLKTGHTREAGYGVTASAKQGDRRLILVVTGLPSMQARADEAERLLTFGFREFENYPLFVAGETVTEAEVWLGEAKTVPLVVAENVVVTLPRKSRSDMKVSVGYDGPIPAPIQKGDRLGTLTITAPDAATVELPLLAGADVAKVGVVGRLTAALSRLVGH